MRTEILTREEVLWLYETGEILIPVDNDDQSEVLAMEIMALISERYGHLFNLPCQELYLEMQEGGILLQVRRIKFFKGDNNERTIN